MKKSFFYRTLQVASIIAAYSAIYIWASTTHVEPIYSILTDLDALLVSLALAIALPFFCFKVLRKLYTPPQSLQLQNLPQSKNRVTATESYLDNDELDVETMQYRGMRYNPDELLTNSDLTQQQGIDNAGPKTVIKYRGVSIESESKPQNIPASEPKLPSQETTRKLKQKIKYRGVYID
jgi:hypothetical protein